jgi:hypothetical protein
MHSATSFVNFFPFINSFIIPFHIHFKQRVNQSEVLLDNHSVIYIDGKHIHFDGTIVPSQLKKDLNLSIKTKKTEQKKGHYLTLISGFLSS